MRMVLHSGFFGILLLGAPAYAPVGGPPPAAPVQSPGQIAEAARVITPMMMLDHVKALAADDKEGRAPGTVGEERTVAYLVGQFKRLGLGPGNPDGTYVQHVPLIGFTGQATAAFDATASFTVKNAIRSLSSRNVIGRLEGRDPALKHEYVMYSAHWDGFGANRALPGDQVLNGALDNGSGMATMLAMAEAFTRLAGGTKRSVLFLSPTAEESAMLGAKFYAEHPLWPLEKTLADINMDIMNFWGRTKAIVSIGYGMTTLDDLLAAEAAKQGRSVLPDPEAEKGYFYRSDHFELAKQGVPALHFLHPGAEYRDRPADYGQRMRDRYTAEDYHKVSDDVKADWDLSGAVQDAQLLFGVGLAVAQGSAYPEWKPGTEFRAIRAARLKAKTAATSGTGPG